MTGQVVRTNGKNHASDVPALEACEKWEYELAGVFVRDTILTEMPEE
jgi:hypothetical protein